LRETSDHQTSAAQKNQHSTHFGNDERISQAFTFSAVTQRSRSFF
jgi:hypothetical protein